MVFWGYITQMRHFGCLLFPSSYRRPSVQTSEQPDYIFCGTILAILWPQTDHETRVQCLTYTCVHLTPINLKKLNYPLVLHPFVRCSLSCFIPLSRNPPWKRQNPEAMADVTGTTENDSHGFVERATGCA